jgi:hypothetical protein
MRGIDGELCLLLRSYCKFKEQFRTEISLLRGGESTLAVWSGK